MRRDGRLGNWLCWGTSLALHALLLALLPAIPATLQHGDQIIRLSLVNARAPEQAPAECREVTPAPPAKASAPSRQATPKPATDEPAAAAPPAVPEEHRVDPSADEPEQSLSPVERVADATPTMVVSSQTLPVERALSPPAPVAPQPGAEASKEPSATAPIPMEPAPVVEAIDPPADEQELLRNYAAQVKQRILREKYYPAAARRLEQTGAVKVGLTIDADGELLDVVIKRSSGYSALDRAASDTVHRAAPFARLPMEVQRERLSLTVTLDYSLD